MTENLISQLIFQSGLLIKFFNRGHFNMKNGILFCPLFIYLFIWGLKSECYVVKKKARVVTLNQACKRLFLGESVLIMILVVALPDTELLLPLDTSALQHRLIYQSQSRILSNVHNLLRQPFGDQ